MGARYAAFVMKASRQLLLTTRNSIWVFLLLGMEAIRTYRANPHLVIGTHHIPTWTTPLLFVVVVAALVPNTSLLGHLCGLGVGYIGMHRKDLPEAHMLTRSY